MTWVRSASWLLASASVLGCTRGNPAFETSGDETFDTETDTQIATEESESGTVAECDYAEGKELTIKLPQPCGETSVDATRYERSFVVVSATATGWLGALCSDPDDVTCMGDCPGDVPQSIEVGPFDVGTLAGAGACLRIKAVQSDPGLESCNFDAIGIWNGNIPLVVASNGNAVISEALAEAGVMELHDKLFENPPCECVEDCCEESPGDYAFEVDGQTIPVGDPMPLVNTPYLFHPLSAHNPTGCASDRTSVWALTYSQ